MTPRSNPARAKDDALISAMLDGRLPESERPAFWQRIANDPAFADRFAAASLLECDLFESPAVDPVHAKPDAERPYWGRSVEGSPSRFRIPPVAYALSGVAAALLLTAAAVAIYAFATKPQSLSPNPSSARIATLIESTGTVIYENTIANPGSEYAAGSYSIESGSAEFLLDSRVAVNLRGKTRLVIHNPMSASLESGSVSFNCPPDAKGFTVHLPDRSRIVDLGTAFRIEVDENGRSELHVFEGRVEWVGADVNAGPVLVMAGQTARLEDGRPVITTPGSTPTLTVTNLGDGPVDLTSIGAADWALWTHGADLTPDVVKSGGRGLGDLRYTGGTLANSNSSKSVMLTWTGGTPIGSARSRDADHLISPAQDETAKFSTSVVASTVMNSLYVVYGQWNATSRLTVRLSDGSVAERTLDISNSTHQTVRIDFASSKAATLEVKIELVDGSDTNINSSLRFQGLALAEAPLILAPSSSTHESDEPDQTEPSGRPRIGDRPPTVSESGDPVR